MNLASSTLANPVATASLADTAPGCERHEFSKAPGYTIGAAWNQDGTKLFVPNPLDGRILVFTATGQHVRDWLRPGEGPGEFNRPYLVQQSSDGFTIQDGLYRLHWFDQLLRPLRTVDLRTLQVTGVHRLSINAFVLQNSTLIGFGTVQQESWHRGVFRVQLTPQAQWLGIEPEVAPSSIADEYTRLTGPLLARAGENAYFLQQGIPAALVQVHPDPLRLRAFPAGFESLQDLPPERGPQGSVIRLRFLESQRLAVAVFGRGDFLYLLTRQPSDAPDGGTRWLLHQVDPKADVIVKTRVLPTTAAHLVVAPGPRWALLEKGRMDAQGRQELKTMVLLPANWIEDPEVSILDAPPSNLCTKHDSK